MTQEDIDRMMAILRRPLGLSLDSRNQPDGVAKVTLWLRKADVKWLLESDYLGFPEDEPVAKPEAVQETLPLGGDA